MACRQPKRWGLPEAPAGLNSPSGPHFAVPVPQSSLLFGMCSAGLMYGERRVYCPTPLSLLPALALLSTAGTADYLTV